MFKATASHMVTVGENVYQLIAHASAPLDELLDVLSMMTKGVQKLKDVAEAAKASKDAEVSITPDQIEVSNG